MRWLEKLSDSDELRIQHNIERLLDLKSVLHDLGYFTTACQSGGHRVLEQLLDDQLVKGRERVHQKLSEALTGENNSKLALDSPIHFKDLMKDAEKLVDAEVMIERRKLVKLKKDQ